MSIYDDMFDLDDHFEKHSASEKTEEAEYIKEAWERISKAHADLERYQIATEETMQGFSAMLRAFNVKRED